MDNRKKISIAISIAVIILFIVVANIYINWSDKLLDQTGVYSVATIEKVEGARGGMMAHVEFMYQGKLYKIKSVDASGNTHINDKGKRVFIKFIPRDPTLLCSYRMSNIVPDSIKEAPFNGWDSTWMSAHFSQAL